MKLGKDQNGEPVYMKLYLDHSYSSRRWQVELCRWDSNKETMGTFYQAELDYFAMKAYLWDRETLIKQSEKRSEVCFGGEVYFSGELNFYRLKSCAKLGAYLDRELDKLSNKYGRANSFAEYVLRVADVLKVKAFIVPSPKWYREQTGSKWRCVDGATARSFIDLTHVEYIKELFPEAPEVAA